MDRHELIKDIRGECECEKCEYCPLEMLVAPNQRNLEQYKLIEILKIERSDLLKRDIGWDVAGKMYVDEGYAKKFAEVYDEKYNHKDLAKLVGLKIK